MIQLKEPTTNGKEIVMSTIARRRYRGEVTKKLINCLLSGVMVVGLMPSFAFALTENVDWSDSTAVTELLAQTTQLSGGQEIIQDGVYKLDPNYSGTYKIGEGLDVVIVGEGVSKVYSGVSLQIGEGTHLTLKDFYANQATTQDKGTIYFSGNGRLSIEGINEINNDGGLNAAVIHIGKGFTLDLDGSGLLYGYKSALCSYIGGDANEANGAINFKGGYWHIKGTKTGAVIGGDSTSVKGDTITISGGELYCKGVARGALIGGSNQGLSGDVVITGGLIELFQDFSGPAIGAGNSANVGNVTITGGSLKTVRSANSWAKKGEDGTYHEPSVETSGVIATGAENYAILPVDVSSVTGDVKVMVDDKDFYSGRTYTYVTNEVKNPTAAQTTGALSDTQANWLTNDANWLVTKADYGTAAYPTKSGSSFVPENNLYLYLTKGDHTVTVNGTTTKYAYDADADEFYAMAPITEVATASDLARLANTVNAGVDYKDVTVTLKNDIALTGTWTPIGNASYAFNGTFDGAGHTISGLSITDGTGGYKGLFGNNAGTIKDVNVSGSIGALSAGTDNIAGIAGHNSGTVSGCVNDVAVEVTTSAIYAVGGIVGQNEGVITECANNAAIKGVKAVGGICGRSYGENAVISKCVNRGDVTGSGGGKDQIGGIVGGLGNKEAITTVSVATNCYNLGSVSNPNGRWVGGIAGFATKGASITNCYNAGVIGDAYKNNGGLICYADSGVGTLTAFTNNYALNQEGYAGESENGTKLSSDDLKAAASLLGDAYKSACRSYPLLTWEKDVDAPALSLSSETESLKVGDTLTVAINMANISASGDATITFSDNLKLENIVAGSALSGKDLNFQVTKDKGFFSFLANESVSDGTVAVATFTCVSAGKATVGATGGYAGYSADSDEYKIVDATSLECTVNLNGTLGDVNNSGTINIVDAQIAYDIAANRYAEGEALTSLIACWGNGATLDLIKVYVDVNADGTVDALDARAIQYYVHYGSFGK